MHYCKSRNLNYVESTIRWMECRRKRKMSLIANSSCSRTIVLYWNMQTPTMPGQRYWFSFLLLFKILFFFWNMLSGNGALSFFVINAIKSFSKAYVGNSELQAEFDYAEKIWRCPLFAFINQWLNFWQIPISNLCVMLFCSFVLGAWNLPQQRQIFLGVG